MRKNKSIEILFCFLILLSLVSPIAAQTRTKPIIFAVLNDGQTLEPIAHIEKGKLTATVNGSDDNKIIAAFNKTFYKPKSTYRLIFGGANAGTVTIKSSDAKAECSKNLAVVTTQSAKTKLKGFVMGLATNAQTKKVGSGVRRSPTAAERAEIESLVRAEFTKQKVSASALKTLKYHNLTALDINNTLCAT